MNGLELEDLRKTWVARASALDPDVNYAVIKLIANGMKVTPEALGGALGISPDVAATHIAAALRMGAEVDGDAIVGAALTMVPTQHRFRVRKNDLYTWCGFDAIFLPMMLGERAEVSSTCAVTGSPIELTVEADGRASSAWPVEVAVGIVGESVTSCCEVSGPQSAVCTQMPFFSSREVADRWLDNHPGVAAVDLDQARDVATAYVGACEKGAA